MNSNHKHGHQSLKPEQEPGVIQASGSAPEPPNSAEPAEVALTEPVQAETELALRQSLGGC